MCAVLETHILTNIEQNNIFFYTNIEKDQYNLYTECVCVVSETHILTNIEQNYVYFQFVYRVRVCEYVPF